jgi:hypothetical protein
MSRLYRCEDCQENATYKLTYTIHITASRTRTANFCDKCRKEIYQSLERHRASRPLSGEKVHYDVAWNGIWN